MRTMVVLTLLEVTYERFLRGGDVASVSLSVVVESILERLPVRMRPTLVLHLRRTIAHVFPIYKNRRARTKFFKLRRKELEAFIKANRITIRGGWGYNREAR